MIRNILWSALSAWLLVGLVGGCSGSNDEDNGASEPGPDGGPGSSASGGGEASGGSSSSGGESATGGTATGGSASGGAGNCSPNGNACETGIPELDEYPDTIFGPQSAIEGTPPESYLTSESTDDCGGDVVTYAEMPSGEGPESYDGKTLSFSLSLDSIPENMALADGRSWQLTRVSTVEWTIGCSIYEKAEYGTIVVEGTDSTGYYVFTRPGRTKKGAYARLEKGKPVFMFTFDGEEKYTAKMDDGGASNIFLNHHHLSTSGAGQTVGATVTISDT